MFDTADARRVLANSGYCQSDPVPFDELVDILVETVEDAVREADYQRDEEPFVFEEDCARCGKKFQTTANVKYCSKGCEMGYLPGTWWC
jgi:hypothetical protein